MKTLHVSASLSRKAGGIFEIELALAKALSASGVAVSAHGLQDGEWQQDKSRWSGVAATVHPVLGPRALGYSPRLLASVLADASDLAHLHTLWMYPSSVIHRWHRRSGRPYLVTPNGMLEPWALRNSAWKKKLAQVFYENRMLHDATCLQANTEKELDDIRAFGLKNPIAIIPNGVNLPDLTDNGQPAGGDRPRVLLFLGRLHPKKGLVNAIRAWHILHSSDSGQRTTDGWQFVVAGWDQGGHEAELKGLATELGIRWADVRGQVAGGPNSSFQLLFAGPAFGASKDNLFRRASAFILPSFSEGLPMSVLEAWAYGLPVLMTDHCNLPEGFVGGAAIHIGTEVGSQEVRGGRQGAGGGDGPRLIAEGMRNLMVMADAERASMGLRGRELVERQFTWPQVAAQMKEVYAWMLAGGKRPWFVRKT